MKPMHSVSRMDILISNAIREAPRIKVQTQVKEMDRVLRNAKNLGTIPPRVGDVFFGVWHHMEDKI